MLPEWFVFIGDSPVGPLRREQILERLENGALAGDALAWRSDLEDWISLDLLPDFQEAAQLAPKGMTIPWEFSDLIIEENMTESPARSIATQPEPARKTQATTDLKKSEIKTEFKSALEFPNTKTIDDGEWAELISALNAPRAPVSKWLWVRSFFLDQPKNLAIAGAVVLTVLASAVVIGRLVLISPLDGISDLDRDDLPVLRMAMKTPLGRKGPAAGVAMSRSDIVTPTFYLATNLPDEAQLVLSIEGIPGTLIGRVHSSAKANVAIRGGIGKSLVFRNEDGTPQPKGEYNVKVYCTTCGLDLAKGPLAERRFFIGGERDADYERRIATYRQQIKRQAQDELNEIKQWLGTLETLFQSSVDEFKVSDGSGKRRVATRSRELLSSWREFHQKWLAMDEQMEAAFSRWTPEALAAGTYHGSLFLSLKDQSVKIRALHRRLNERMENSALIAIDGSFSDETDGLRSSLAQLRKTIESVENLPPISTGLPGRL